MIELKNIYLGYGEKILLENVTTKFPKAQLTALIGRNGSGKSTLLKSICGLNNDYKGEIFINNQNLKFLIGNRFAKMLAYVNTQRPRMANLRCVDVVALGRSPYTGWNGKLNQTDKDKVNESLELVGMAEYKKRYFNSLSDGESQKIMIARAISQNTEIIILDEPTSFLDLPTRYELVNLLRRLVKEKSKTIIFSTHELDIALEMSDRIALLNHSELINLSKNEMIASNHIQSLFNTPDHFVDRYLSFLMNTTNQK